MCIRDSPGGKKPAGAVAARPVPTIGDAPATGLCGSGILSAISAFLRAGCILSRGNLGKAGDRAADDPRKTLLCERAGKPALRIGRDESGIVLTRKDVRQVRLAKGAILFGSLALLERRDLTMDAVDRVLLACLDSPANA